MAPEQVDAPAAPPSALTVTPEPSSAVVPVRDTINSSLAVVDPVPAVRDELAAQLGGGSSPFASIEELGDRLTGAAPVVAVIGPSGADPTQLAAVAALVNRFPMVGCILVTEQVTTSLLQQALRAGVRDVVAIHSGPAVLAEAVQRVSASVEHAIVTVTVPGGTTAPNGPGPAHAPSEGHPDAAASDPPHRGSVVTVFSPKGGSGTTVVATSLAVALAERSTRPVCIVDADLQFGDVAVLLKLAPHHTIVDAVASIDRLDAAMLESLLVTHEPSGLRVLPAPLEPAYADQVGASDLVRILGILREICDYVVVDTPSYLNDVVLSILDESDSVELVAGLDIPSVKNLKVTLQTLRLLEVPEEKLHLVLNRADSKVKLDVAEVERALHFEARSQIPSDVVVPQSVNRGEPVVTHAPRSGVAKAITVLADHYVAPRASRTRRRR
jgi:pilus assembly protein CpaE